MAKVEHTMLLLLGSMLSVGPASPLGMSPFSGGEAKAGKVFHPQEWCLGSELWNTAEMSEMLLSLSQRSLLQQGLSIAEHHPSSPLPPDPLPSPLPPPALPPFLPLPHFSTVFPLPLFTFLTSLARVLLLYPSLPQQGQHCGKHLCLIFIPEKNFIHFSIFYIFLLSFFACFCPPLSSPFLLSFLLPSAFFSSSFAYYSSFSLSSPFPSPSLHPLLKVIFAQLTKLHFPLTPFPGFLTSLFVIALETWELFLHEPSLCLTVLNTQMMVP